MFLVILVDGTLKIQRLPKWGSGGKGETICLAHKTFSNTVTSPFNVHEVFVSALSMHLGTKL